MIEYINQLLKNSIFNNTDSLKDTEMHGRQKFKKPESEEELNIEVTRDASFI